MGRAWERISRVVVDGIVAFGVEKEYKIDDEDNDNDGGGENYGSASEQACSCTFVRYQNCFLSLTQNQIYWTLALVAVSVIVKTIAAST